MPSFSRDLSLMPLESKSSRGYSLDEMIGVLPHTEYPDQAVDNMILENISKQQDRVDEISFLTVLLLWATIIDTFLHKPEYYR